MVENSRRANGEIAEFRGGVSIGFQFRFGRPDSESRADLETLATVRVGEHGGNGDEVGTSSCVPAFRQIAGSVP